MFNKTRRWTGAALATVLLAQGAWSQTAVPWSDDFEQSTNAGYLPGVDPTGGSAPFVSLGGWEQWDLTLANGARISTTFANSGTQSLFNGGDSDIVQRFNVSTGRWILKSQVYVPTAATSVAEEMTIDTWYIWLHLYNVNGPKDWAMQFNFNPATGNAQYSGGPNAGVSMNYTSDKWIDIEVQVDLDADSAVCFLDGVQFGAQWQWTQGTGVSANPARLSAIDLWSNLQTGGTNPNGGASYDDIEVKPDGTLTTTFCTAKTLLACGPASISATGTSSAVANSGFTISAGPTRGCRNGLLLYTNQPPVAGAAFGGPGDGVLCLLGMGLRRAGPIDAGGTAPNVCDGNMAIDFNAFANGAWAAVGCNPPPGQNNPAAYANNPGVTISAQIWGRDSVATGQVLSDAIQWVVGP
jgi:hypothetical protein